MFFLKEAKQGWWPLDYAGTGFGALVRGLRARSNLPKGHWSFRWRASWAEAFAHFMKWLEVQTPSYRRVVLGKLVPGRLPGCDTVNWNSVIEQGLQASLQEMRDKAMERSQEVLQSEIFDRSTFRETGPGLPVHGRPSDLHYRLDPYRLVHSLAVQSIMTLSAKTAMQIEMIGDEDMVGMWGDEVLVRHEILTNTTIPTAPSLDTMVRTRRGVTAARNYQRVLQLSVNRMVERLETVHAS